MSNIFKTKEQNSLTSSSVEIETRSNHRISIPAIFDRDEKMSELVFLFALNMKDSTRYSPKSVPTYFSAISVFIRHVLENEKCDHLSIDELLLSVNAYQVNSFLNDMRQSRKSDDYICTCDAALKTFYQWVDANHSFHQTLLQDFKSPYMDNRAKALRPHHRVVRHIDSENVVNFLKFGIQSENIRCAIHFMFDTGLRISEILRLKVGDILGIAAKDRSKDFIKVKMQSSKGRGGTKPMGHFFVSKVVFDRTMNLLTSSGNLKDSEPLFNLKNGKELKSSTLQQIIYRASKKLLKNGLLKNKITAHMFRHGTAFSLLKFHGTTDLETLVFIKEMLRHKSMRSIESYISINYIEITNGREDDISKGIVSRLEEARYIFENSFN